MSLTEKWLKFVNNMNGKGVPVPLARIDGKPSASFSLVVVSAGLCTISILMMLGVAISKLSGIFVVNPESMTSVENAFMASLQFFGACGALYFGRKFQTDKDKKINMDDKV